MTPSTYYALLLLFHGPGRRHEHPVKELDVARGGFATACAQLEPRPTTASHL
jgi:hypothetical protein